MADAFDKIKVPENSSSQSFYYCEYFFQDVLEKNSGKVFRRFYVIFVEGLQKTYSIKIAVTNLNLDNQMTARLMVEHLLLQNLKKTAAT